MNRRTFYLGLTGLAGCSTQPRLNVFNWSNYITPEVLRDFEKETGARVRYAIYESNEELLARILSGNSGWDVVFPTHYFIEPLLAARMLAPLRAEWLPGARHLAPEFARPPWDAGRRWSLPYMWGASGILYDSRLPGAPVAYADLWNRRWAGRMTMLDDPAEVLGASLLKLGLSVNATTAAELRRAQAEALRQKPLLRAYLNAEVRDQAVAGDVLACQIFTTTAQQAIDAAPHLAFAFPREGFSQYVDCAVILRESRRVELAHRFLDFLFRPPVAAAIAAACRTTTVNAAARKLLPRDVRALPTLYPDAATLQRGQWFAAMPPAAQRLRDRLWTEIKAA